MPRHSPFAITLTVREREELEALARRYTSSYREVVRAKIVLYAAAGLRNDEIGARLDMPRQIVSKWRKRFAEQRMPGLAEQSRQGRGAAANRASQEGVGSASADRQPPGTRRKPNDSRRARRPRPIGQNGK